jgi:molecular chaperone DnaK
MQTSHKLAEAMYAKASGAAQAGGEQAAGAEPSAEEPGSKPSQDENVVDADFEEVKDNK